MVSKIAASSHSNGWSRWSSRASAQSWSVSEILGLVLQDEQGNNVDVKWVRVATGSLGRYDVDADWLLRTRGTEKVAIYCSQGRPA